MAKPSKPSFRQRLGAFIAGGFGGKRSYDGGMIGRLTADWIATNSTADAELRGNIRLLVNRCRDLERNNDYVRGFLDDLEANVIGSPDLDIQSKFEGENAEQSDAANQAVQDAWAKWCRAESCTMSGLDAWHDVKRLGIRAIARDGTFLVRKIRGSAARNRFNFSLQLLEVDHLNIDGAQGYPASPDNFVRWGIEHDSYGRPVAYHLRSRHPGDYGMAGPNLSPQMNIVRVPADEIVCVFRRTRTTQSLGEPWFVSAMTRLQMLAKYEEAELVAARVGACKMGFIVTTQPDALDSIETGVDQLGQRITDASPGTFEELPYGKEVRNFDPQHPTQAFDMFRKAMLRGIASGLSMSYATLANDLTEVNFSSMRAGLLDEREGWKMIQRFYRDNFLQPIFEAWLEQALLSGAIEGLGVADYERLRSPKWKPRRWAWVDPEADINAAILAVQNGFSSRSAFISEAGGDVDEVFTALASDEAKAEAHGIEFAPPTSAGRPPVNSNPNDNAETKQAAQK